MVPAGNKRFMVYGWMLNGGKGRDERTTKEKGETEKSVGQSFRCI